jgi:hypothetical protein
MTVTQSDLFGGKTTVKHANRAERPRSTVASILNLGAGVQSSTLAEMIVLGELPRVTFALFADTGDEPDYVYQQVEYIKAKLASIDIPLGVVRRDGPGLIESILNSDSKLVSMPLYTRQPNGKVSIIKRQCTANYKIEPCDNYTLDYLITHDSLDKRAKKEFRAMLKR